jgi:hypothetical protein
MGASCHVRRRRGLGEIAIRVGHDRMHESLLDITELDLGARIVTAGDDMD